MLCLRTSFLLFCLNALTLAEGVSDNATDLAEPPVDGGNGTSLPPTDEIMGHVASPEGATGDENTAQSPSLPSTSPSGGTTGLKPGNLSPGSGPGGRTPNAPSKFPFRFSGNSSLGGASGKGSGFRPHFPQGGASGSGSGIRPSVPPGGASGKGSVFRPHFPQGGASGSGSGIRPSVPPSGASGKGSGFRPHFPQGGASGNGSGIRPSIPPGGASGKGSGFRPHFPQGGASGNGSGIRPSVPPGGASGKGSGFRPHFPQGGASSRGSGIRPSVPPDGASGKQPGFRTLYSPGGSSGSGFGLRPIYPPGGASGNGRPRPHTGTSGVAPPGLHHGNWPVGGIARPFGKLKGGKIMPWQNSTGLIDGIKMRSWVTCNVSECLNGASCVEHGFRRCICPPGFHGGRCQDTTTTGHQCAFQCTKQCVYGYETDAAGSCYTCTCRDNPCKDAYCHIDEVCRLTKDRCLRVPCPPPRPTCVPKPKNKTLDACPTITCKCRYGSLVDNVGCPTCICRDNPCEMTLCDNGMNCVLQRQDCKDTDSCNREGFFKAVCRLETKTGQCPLMANPIPPHLMIARPPPGKFKPLVGLIGSPVSSMNSCERQCDNDTDCYGLQKCCPNGCGRGCVMPRLTDKSACVAELELRSETNGTGQVPKCTRDGLYHSRQCQVYDSGQTICYCADIYTGHIIRGTFNISTTDSCSDKAAVTSCPDMTCKKDCPFGFVENGEGCPTCYCSPDPCKISDVCPSELVCAVLRYPCRGRDNCTYLTACILPPYNDSFCREGEPLMDENRVVRCDVARDVTGRVFGDTCPTTHQCQPMAARAKDIGMCCPKSRQIKQGERAGECPDVDVMTSLMYSCTTQCLRDSDCASPLKCCSSPCGRDCVFPSVNRNSSCQTALEEAILILEEYPALPIHIPRCHYNGTWQRVQCHDGFGVCWCVDSQGGRVPGTQRRGLPPDCNTPPRTDIDQPVCPPHQPVHICPVHLCLTSRCEAHPGALCRVNPCGGCKVQFLDNDNNPVECFQPDGKRVSTSKYCTGSTPCDFGGTIEAVTRFVPLSDCLRRAAETQYTVQDTTLILNEDCTAYVKATFLREYSTCEKRDSHVTEVLRMRAVASPITAVGIESLVADLQALRSGVSVARVLGQAQGGAPSPGSRNQYLLPPGGGDDSVTSFPGLVMLPVTHSPGAAECPSDDFLRTVYDNLCVEQCQRDVSCGPGMLCCPSHCGHVCVPTREKQARCFYSKTEDLCPGEDKEPASTQWYYDAEGGECRQFQHGGCGGSDHVFPSVQDCMEACSDVFPMRGVVQLTCRVDGAFTNSVCHQGLCWCVSAEGVPTAGTLTRAQHILCDIHGNPMIELNTPAVCPDGSVPSICMDQCSQATCHPATPMDTDAAVTAFMETACLADPCSDCAVRQVDALGQEVPCSDTPMCEQPSEPGPCKAKVNRWAFDQASQRCRPFVYGGCQGNANNFASEHDCQLQCGGLLCPDDPVHQVEVCDVTCEHARCDRFPEALCIPDPCSCQPVFLDVQTMKPVTCQEPRSLCERQRAEIGRQSLLTAGHKRAPYVPQCATDGAYVPKQCSDDGGYCWCVDDAGEPLAHTKVKVTGDDEALGSMCEAIKTLAVEVRFAFPNAFSTIAEREEEFKGVLIEVIAMELNVSATYIRDMSVSPGSIIVQFAVRADQSLTIDLRSLFDLLYGKLMRGEFSLMFYHEVYTADPGTVHVQALRTTDNSSQSRTHVISAPSTTAASDSGSDTGASVKPATSTAVLVSGVVFPAITLVAVILALVVIIRKRRGKGTFHDNIGFSNQTYRQRDADDSATPPSGESAPGADLTETDGATLSNITLEGFLGDESKA